MTDDKKIIELFFRRSENALLELDIKYGKLCRKLSYNITNNMQDAEECTNDAYLGVWNTIPPTVPCSLVSYLCKIVRNLSIKRYDQSKARKRSCNYAMAMEEIEACIADINTVEKEWEAKELVYIIEAFLESLTKENRVIFVRRYWLSDSYDDIANAMGLTVKTISVRLTRMRKKLKQYIEKEGII